MEVPAKIVRGQVWHCHTDPRNMDHPEKAMTLIRDGAIVINDEGRIIEVDDASAVVRKYPDTPKEEFGTAVICPGFVDAHTHFPQMDIMGAYGQTLLGWLNRYTFPEEEKFVNFSHAESVAMRFVQALLSNGTTTAAIFGSSHRNATEALCQEISRRGLRAIVGKSSMDRNAPASLLVHLDQELEDLQTLFERWHGRGERLWCALAPRFAPACTQELLMALGQLRTRFPSVYVQSHVSENLDEIQLVKELFPQDHDYFAVYERFGLVGERSMYAHGVHLTEHELERMAATNTALVHCPSSNAFLGSGLLDLQRVKTWGIKTALGTDVGAGTTFSMIRTQLDAYKIQKLSFHSVNPVELFFYSTLGGAQALHLDAICGNFMTGKAADFVVIDWPEDSALAHRMHRCENVSDHIFALATLADDRNVQKVFIQGSAVYERS